MLHISSAPSPEKLLNIIANAFDMRAFIEQDHTVLKSAVSPPIFQDLGRTVVLLIARHNGQPADGSQR
jgi:hypothetical protein